MAFMYDQALKDLENGILDMDTDTIKCTLLMTNTTCDTESTVATVSAFTDRDENDSVTFTFAHGGDGRRTLTGVAVTVSAGTMKFDATDVTYALLANGIRNIDSVLVHREGTTNDTDAIPILYMDYTTSQSPGGSNFIVTWPAGGLYTKVNV